MLQDLKILNGEMPLKFDPLNTIYTINLTEDEDFLKIDYEIADNALVSIYGNKLTEGLNEVVLTVYNDEDLVSYYLYVYKEKPSVVMAIDTSVMGLQKENTELASYVIPSIASICFIFILLFFTLLFKKKKKCRFNKIGG